MGCAAGGVRSQRSAASPCGNNVLRLKKLRLRVEIVTSRAGANGTVLLALVAQGAQGLVVAGTGNATVHPSPESPFLEHSLQINLYRLAWVSRLFAQELDRVKRVKFLLQCLDCRCLSLSPLAPPRPFG